MLGPYLVQVHEEEIKKYETQSKSQTSWACHVRLFQLDDPTICV